MTPDADRRGDRLAHEPGQASYEARARLPSPQRRPGLRRLLAACGGARLRRHRAAGTTITLYSGQHEQTAQSLVSGFEKKTGINVVVRSDDEDVLADQIATEGTHSPADVFFTENSPPLESLQAKGLLAALPPARWPARRASSARRKATGSASRPGSACWSTTRA